MTATDIRTADQPPLAARLLRDFVNTAEPQTGGEELASPDALATWAASHGLLPAGARLRAGDLADGIAVREGLRAVLQAHAGHDAPSAPLDALDDVLGRVALRAGFDASGDLRLGAAADDALAALVAGLLDAARRAAEDGSWARLKVCAKDSCRWAFYDTSRNRSARWCSMAGCGNQVKMQRAHARRRGSSGDGADADVGPASA
jgi:predicted RNA-binding Zn ribbon-like protein